MTKTPKQQATTEKGLSFLAQPISRILLAGFLLVALVPVGFLGYKLYKLAWQDAWREIMEKHQLLAKNLAAPISIYIQDQENALALLSDFIAHSDSVTTLSKSRAPADFASKLRTGMQRLKGFNTISLVDLEGRILISTTDIVPEDILMSFKDEQCFMYTRKNRLPRISGIKTSPFTGKPTLLLSYPVMNMKGSLVAVLMGELKVPLIEDLRRKIQFGIKGHSAIVDQNGHVIAHPNPDWMETMKDLSGLQIVRNMMAGKSGVTEFYSPFIKANMVAGYASVPKLGWGIMVPQPKSEVEAHVNRLLYAQLGWGAFGLFLAIMLTFVLLRWITDPLRALCRSASEIIRHGLHGQIPPLSRYAPREVHELRDHMSELVEGLQDSRRLLDQYNTSLEGKIMHATEELQEANRRLHEMALQDYLTSLANRRHFESSLMTSLATNKNTANGLSLMLIDVDYFKRINDQHGHATGDMVLTELAEILQNNTRPGDLASRYAGDEFMVLMHCSREVAEKRARDLLDQISAYCFVHDGHEIRVSVSIGLVCQQSDTQLSKDVLLSTVDEALYAAKGDGRNCVSVVGV